MPGQAETGTLLARYRQTLVQMHACRIEHGGSPRRWNRLANQLQRLHLALRQQPEGRAGISELINDELLTVRQWAATHALSWDEPAARAELEWQAAVGPGLSGLEAKDHTARIRRRTAQHDLDSEVTASTSRQASRAAARKQECRGLLRGGDL